MNIDKELERLEKQTEAELESIEKSIDIDIRKRARPPSIYIGSNALSKPPGNDLYLSIEKLAVTHTYILGSSGMGKSKFLERMARDIIKNRYGLLILDGKNDLYDTMLNVCCFLNLSNRTILIDPNDYEYSVGINYLETLGATSPDALAGIVLDGLKKFFKETGDYKPWLEEWAPACLISLIKEKLTLLELFAFLKLKDPDFRNALISRQDEKFFREKWEELEAFKKTDQAAILNVLKTRASKFWQDRSLKGIFGQLKTTIDWLNVMNNGAVVLSKLGNTEKASPETCRLIGTAILHQLNCVASSRPKGKRKPFFVIIDEFQKFITPDIADGLERLRGFGIYFILAHQYRGQVEQENPALLKSIDSNCLNRVIFNVSAEDAKAEMENLFAGWIRADRRKDIKDEIIQTKFRPVKSEEHIYSESNSESSGSSSAKSLLESSIINSEGEARVSTEGEGAVSGSSRSEGTARSETTVPWYDYEEFQEVSSRTYYSLDEIREKYISWIKRQDGRNAQWKFLNKRPIPIITPFINDVAVIESKLKRFKDSVNSKYARLTEEVINEIEARVPKYLENLRLEEDSQGQSEKIKFRQKKPLSLKKSSQ